MGLLAWFRVYATTLMCRRESSFLVQVSLAASTFWLTVLLLVVLPQTRSLPTFGDASRVATATLPVLRISIGAIILILIPPAMGFVVTSFSMFRESRGYLPRSLTEGVEATSMLVDELRASESQFTDSLVVALRGLGATFRWLGLGLLVAPWTAVKAARWLAHAPREESFFIAGHPSSLELVADTLADAMRAAGHPPRYVLLSAAPSGAPSAPMRLAASSLGRVMGAFALLGAERARVLVTGSDVTGLGDMQAIRRVFLLAAPRLGPHLVSCEHPKAADLERALNRGQTASWPSIDALLSEEGVTLEEASVLADKATPAPC
jgi:hypothetical protein